MGNGDAGFDMGGREHEAAATAAAALGINMQQHHSNKITNFVSAPSPYYHHNHPLQPSTNGLPFGTNYHLIASGVSLEPSTGGSERGGVMAAGGGGKVLFTATQWQELERQTMIYKYIVASIPVPPQLLTPLSTQSNRVGMDMRLSSGSDPEPWRCRRTDGKKWRCSRDVAPDQKYCERHAHKSRPRSRKPVEIQSHNTTTTTITPPPSATLPLPTATPSYQHPRCTEWFMKSGASTTPVSTSNNPFQQSVDSPRVGSKRDHIFSKDFEGNESHINHGNLELNASLIASASARRQQFIDAWSRSGGGGGDNCSLTLSMQCSSVGTGGMNESFQMSDVERGGDVLKWQATSWMGSPPGGPLGEALRLGTASATNVPSPHGSREHGGT